MNEPQRLALRAATADHDRSLVAWRELVDRHDLADLWDDELYRLLPLVLHRLGDEVGRDHVGLLEGLHRRAWVERQHLARRGGEVVAGLQSEGVDPLVLDGAALGALAYGDPVTRPVQAVDLLVDPTAAVATWRHLERRGYRPRPASVPTVDRWWRAPDDGWYLRLRRPRTFDRGPLDVVVVHTTLAPELVVADPEVADLSALWSSAVDLGLGETLARTPALADHLLRTLLLLADDGPGQLGRIVDARHLVHRAERRDWELLTTRASHHRCSLVVADVLERLPREWEVPVSPCAPADLLGAAPPDRRQRIAVRLRAPRFPGSQAAARFVTASRGLGPVATVAAIPSFLTDRWQVDRRRHLPLAAATRLCRARR